MTSRHVTRSSVFRVVANQEVVQDPSHSPLVRGLRREEQVPFRPGTAKPRPPPPPQCCAHSGVGGGNDGAPPHATNEGCRSTRRWQLFRGGNGCGPRSLREGRCPRRKRPLDHTGLDESGPRTVSERTCPLHLARTDAGDVRAGERPPTSHAMHQWGVVSRASQELSHLALPSVASSAPPFFGERCTGVWQVAVENSVASARTRRCKAATVTQPLPVAGLRSSPLFFSGFALA